MHIQDGYHESGMDIMKEWIYGIIEPISNITLETAHGYDGRGGYY
tara:strand:+ start:122 stop:256 length:135 start_codon:yes stop_codon:yes gene_type:complete